MPRVDGKIVARSHDVNDGLNVAEVDLGMNTLGIQVESEVDEVDIACSLSVSEQAAFHTIGTRKNTELSSSDASA